VAARNRLTVFGASLAAAVALVAMPDGAAQTSPPAAGRWILEPGPEAPNAQAQGAADVERAQKLAKAKDYAEAAKVLEALARRLPAAVHDCNLALVYLRASALTKAQLMWDLSGLRNGTRPKWCTGDVSTQLSQALRVAGYVPTTIDVVPTDAVIEVGGVAMRGMRTVWLPPGPATISASAPGKDTQTITAAVAAPSTRVPITLVEPTPAGEPDAGVTPVTPVAVADAAVATPRPDAAVNVQPVSPGQGATEGKPVATKYIALGTSVVGWLGAGVLGLLTIKARDEANSVYVTDPVFARQRDKYDTYKWAATGSLGLAVIATAVTVYLFTRSDEPPPTNTVQVGVGDGGFAITYGGTFGGAR
jgi:hypothetical protein